jgi:hypothetical protein
MHQFAPFLEGSCGNVPCLAEGTPGLALQVNLMSEKFMMVKKQWELGLPCVKSFSLSGS